MLALALIKTILHSQIVFLAEAAAFFFDFLYSGLLLLLHLSHRGVQILVADNSKNHNLYVDFHRCITQSGSYLSSERTHILGEKKAIRNDF